MSSMRNAIQRRNHKERAQPKEREKWGLLEKHKDYSLRASDYSEKKKRLKILRQKAADRNPDEFHFEMVSSQARDGGRKISDRGNKSLSHDAVKLLKTQDSGYLRNAAQQTKRSRERLEQSVILQAHMCGSTLRPQNRLGVNDHVRVRFVDSIENIPGYRLNTSNEGEKMETTATEERNKFIATKKFASTGEQNTYTMGQKSNEDQRDMRRARKGRKRVLEAQEYRLQALKWREKELLSANYELESHRQAVADGHIGINKNNLKFKIRERKR